MDARVKELWTTALRESRIGDVEITQATEVLQSKSDNGKPAYCCLGVLCELARLDGVDIRKSNPGPKDYDMWTWEQYEEEYSFEWTEQEDQDLPSVVMKWAGIEVSNPYLIGPGEVSHAASTWNDDEGKSFAEIADMIDKSL